MEGDTSVLIVPEFMHLDISENRIKTLINAGKPKSVSTIWSPETCKSKNSEWVYSVLDYKNKNRPSCESIYINYPGKAVNSFQNQGDKQPHTFS
jgi:hypothetical protein